MSRVSDHIWSVISGVRSLHYCAALVSLRVLDAVTYQSPLIDETSHCWTSASCHCVVPSSPSIFRGLEHHVIHNITATLQPDRPFLSRCDQINLDGSETMNDDITIWAPATCHSKKSVGVWPGLTPAPWIQCGVTGHV